MNRMSETYIPTSSARAYYHEHGEMPPVESAAVNECENCGHASETLVHVPEWNFMGCDDCMEECMTILAAEKSGRAMYACDRQALAVARKSVGRETLATQEAA